jgi:predicted phosphate transport protein (TIGR00153 family)
METTPVAERREQRGGWRLLLRALRPRDKRFFVAFDQHAAICVEGMRGLRQLLADVRDPDGRVRDIEALEKRGDAIVDEVRHGLRRSLFPPFSRVTVHALINDLDDILDLIEDAAQSVHLYHITLVTPEALRLADLGIESALKLQGAIGQLARLDSAPTVLTLCSEVDQLEAQADHVMRSAMARLFRDEADARQLVKLKAIYELLEELTDRCKDVANEVSALILGRRA